MATVVKPLAAHESLSKSHDPQEAVEAARVLVDVDSIHTEDSSEETTPGTTEGERGKEANESHAGEMSTNSPPEAKHKTPTDKAGGRTVRREFARMGRRMARALERLEDNLDDESSKGISKNVQGGLNALRDLISTLKYDQVSEFDGTTDSDSEVGTQCGVKRATMESWKNGLGEKDSTPVIMAYYRSIPTFAQGTEHTTLVTKEKGPQRVVIHSEKLVDELDEMTQIMSGPRPVILAQPYKLLIRCYPQIIDGLAKLRERLAEKDEGASGNQDFATAARERDVGISSTKTAKSSDMSTTSSAPTMLDKGKLRPDVELVKKQAAKQREELNKRITLVQLLCDFIKSDLGYYLDLEARANNGTLEKIVFEDLWYLFRPGETILVHDKDGHEQLYKVYAVSGGQTRKYDSRQTKEEIQNTTTKTFCAKGSWVPLNIDCYQLAFNGDNVGPEASPKQIKYFAGETNISDLPIYPVHYHKDKEALLSRLEARGRKYLTTYGHKRYDGMTQAPVDDALYRRYLRDHLFSDLSDIIQRRQSRKHVRGDVFVDAKAYYVRLPREKPDLGALEPTEPEETTQQELVKGEWRYLTDSEVDEKIFETFMAHNEVSLDVVGSDKILERPNDLCLLTWQIPCFVFLTRRFEMLDVEVIEDINRTGEPRDTGFRDLVIPERNRELLIAMVKDHVTDPKHKLKPADGTLTQIDVVKGKGRGLIILLHGPPGSGKTSTAEALAAYTRRPLYSITCGDLGTEPEHVERNLQEHTTRAHQWGCVLLLDEADVFVTRRDWRDTARNALVSVFLRQLEYYWGIIVLTTNRTGVIDEALKSRIHLPLHYPNIGEKETRQIWENILNRIERNNKAEKMKVKFDRDDLLEYAINHYRQHEPLGMAWNGRQIRNAFQLAIQLGYHDLEKRLKEKGLTPPEAARHPKPKRWMTTVYLTPRNIRSIARIADEFENYLNLTRGMDREYAIDHNLRNDDSVDPASAAAALGGSQGIKKTYGAAPLSGSMAERLVRHRAAYTFSPATAAAQWVPGAGRSGALSADMARLARHPSTKEDEQDEPEYYDKSPEEDEDDDDNDDE